MSAKIIDFPRPKASRAPGPGTIVRVWRWVPEFVDIVAPPDLDNENAKFHANMRAPWGNASAWVRCQKGERRLPPVIVGFDPGGEAP